jgi:hypothetical protein
VIQTALQKRPVDRYRSAAEMSRALAPATAADYVGDTAVLAGPDAMAIAGQGHRAWWMVAAAAVAIAGAVAVFAVVNDGDDPDAATSVPAGPAPTTSPAPTVASTTTTSTTVATVATTVPVAAIAPESPASSEQLIAVFSADPARYGPATPEVIDSLGGITNRGRKSRDRAAELLDDAHSWAAEGRLSEEATGLLEAVLAPLVGGSNDENDDDD